ncbi:hypothetical protein B0H19DRAFT_1192038 [Mycena capillaripes]|nr:hypothetical protein B0H19DRAFT_1192038 [Mycena capillaripes]
MYLTAGFSAQYWDANVYAGLRKSHKAQGFDPDSQELALHLGDPLYQLPEDLIMNDTFPYVDDDTTEDSCQEHDVTPSGGDREPSSNEQSSFNIDGGSSDSIGDAAENVGRSNMEGRHVSPPFQFWNVVMVLQLGLITILALFSLYDVLRLGQ